MAPTEDGFELRRAEPEDSVPLADLFGAARAAAVPAMPPAIHTRTEDRAFFAGLLASRARVWVAESHPGGEPLGFAAIERAWLHSLYVHPDHVGNGVGSGLLEVAKAECPDGFCLWVFETNTPARAFYARRGLIELEHTDGSGNEEGQPDLRMAWPGAEPLVFFRRLIDEVDADLGDVLARRVALTAAVQHHKGATAGAPTRDPGREAEIVDALARRAPALGPERLGRILHSIIHESLEAASRDS